MLEEKGIAIDIKFDAVISNPPYISTNEMPCLQAEVKDYDPEIALTDGSDGLLFYRHFAKIFDDLINPDGVLLLEIGGEKQKKDIEKIFIDAGLTTMFYKDLQGDIRVVKVHY